MGLLVPVVGGVAPANPGLTAAKASPITESEASSRMRLEIIVPPLTKIEIWPCARPSISLAHVGTAKIDEKPFGLIGNQHAPRSRGFRGLRGRCGSSAGGSPSSGR